MFRIGEFSKLTQVSIRMLRYYDETGLLKPAFIDSITGYRMYSVEQIPILHRIIFLRDTGFNVSEIAIALNEWSDQSVTLLLEEKRLAIQAVIRKEQEKLVKIDTAIKDIGNAAISVHCNVSLKNIPAYKVVSLRKKVADYFCEGELWQELSCYIESHRIPIVSPEKSFAIYHDEGHMESDIDIEVCCVVEQMGDPIGTFVFREVEEVDTVVCAMVYGPYENIASAYESVAHWLTQHDQYRMIGMNRQVCHRGPWNEQDSSRYLTEIQIPVIKQSC